MFMFMFIGDPLEVVLVMPLIFILPPKLCGVTVLEVPALPEGLWKCWEEWMAWSSRDGEMIGRLPEGLLLPELYNSSAAVELLGGSGGAPWPLWVLDLSTCL